MTRPFPTFAIFVVIALLICYYRCRAKVFSMLGFKEHYQSRLGELNKRRTTLTNQSDMINTLADLEYALKNCPWYLFKIRGELSNLKYYFLGRLDGFAHNKIRG